MSRETFLHRVRLAAEQGRAYRVATQPQPDRVGYVGAEGDLCEAFAREAIAVGGEVHVVNDLAAARDVVRKLCTQIAAERALCWQHELLDRLGLAELLQSCGIESRTYESLRNQNEASQREAILAAHVGITSCHWAVAETGSLFLWAQPGSERVASLLPPRHIAIVERAQILPDLYDAVAKLHSLGFAAMPSNAVLVTGPSKTGDMELELTTGVHGPGSWCVVVISE